MLHYHANRTGRLMLGKVILAEKARRPTGRRPSLELMRLREIEMLIRWRHGGMVPQTDDADAYLRAAALSGSGQDLRAWCRRWAPWALARAVEIIEPIEQEAAGRKRMLHADAIAEILMVTMAERTALGLKTIGACDVSKAQRAKIAKARKRERDRARQAETRRAQGRKTRAEYEASSTERAQPWKAEGISRRTWYRRNGTGASPHRSIKISDGPVPTAGEAVSSKQTAAPATSAGRAYETIGQGRGPTALGGVRGRSRPVLDTDKAKGRPVTDRHRAYMAALRLALHSPPLAPEHLTAIVAATTKGAAPARMERVA